MSPQTETKTGAGFKAGLRVFIFILYQLTLAIYPVVAVNKSKSKINSYLKKLIINLN
jgi:hypothetical protein